IILALEKTDLLKLNHHELSILSEWFGLNSEQDEIGIIKEKFGIAEVLLTEGEKGATYYGETETESLSGFDVRVVDTVGSGDAFLAGFMAAKLKNESISKCMELANALGGFIASRNGACPPY